MAVCRYGGISMQLILIDYQTPHILDLTSDHHMSVMGTAFITIPKAMKSDLSFQFQLTYKLQTGTNII